MLSADATDEMGTKGETMIWTMEFDEYGGYDSITGAFIIKRKGRRITSIDQGIFGQEYFDYEFRSEAALKWAKFIVDACNEKENV